MPAGAENADSATKRDNTFITNTTPIPPTMSHSHKKRRTHEATIRHGSQAHSTNPSSFELDLASAPMDIPGKSFNTSI
jgi:hypothetical protein